jgi:hypothetical protein
MTRKSPERRQHDLTYGLRDGKLVSIKQLTRGLHPDVLCPACKQPLIAKKGSVKQHHFAHSGEKFCETAAETALHLLAKELVCEPGRILELPKYRIERIVNHQKFCESVAAAKGGRIRFEGGEQEVHFDGLIADAVIQPAGHRDRPLKRLIVEISVTHPAGKAKVRQLRQIGLPAIEIDLSDFLDSHEPTPDAVIAALSSVENIHWLYHPEEGEARRRLAGRISRSRPRKSARDANRRGGRTMEFDLEVEKLEQEKGRPLNIDETLALQQRFFGTRTGSGYRRRNR